MNNAKLALDANTLDEEEPVDLKPMMRERETELAEIIEALENINSSNYWKLLQDKVFSGVVDALARRIAKEKDPTELYRLQGQIVWAAKYMDLNKLAQVYRNELTNVRKNI